MPGGTNVHAYMCTHCESTTDSAECSRRCVVTVTLLMSVRLPALHILEADAAHQWWAVDQERGRL